MRKINASPAIAGSLTALIAWLWNGYVPEPKMTPEVAGAMGALVGHVVAYAVGWLPTPNGGNDAGNS